ncbi:glycosyltransferase family 4 protein [Leptothrix discophora]|uniref:Glycosyltransferase family 4 protein n=1 Tax=Leptothrix discophora TaxID=89 RepID=A0ABT9FY49_LEPDI|nr:glycosyltransferase family 4 protein [Leptothrix discophora]MDP4299066.1 glycosyltransferase family 4 protein [Leptothrix discophora]
MIGFFWFFYELGDVVRILVSAFAIRPNVGSEHGVGWNWVVELAKDGHSVDILTDTSRVLDVERGILKLGLERVRVHGYRPICLRFVPLRAGTAQLLYSAWQYGLFFYARALHLKFSFDVAIHATYGVFRTPSFLGLLGIPFIFGPVGGAEDAPWKLKKPLPISSKLFECLRAIANRLSWFNPFLHLSWLSATLILAKTQQTKLFLPPYARAKTEVYPEIGINFDVDARLFELSERIASNVIDILYVGRLLGWKGGYLVIDAFARILDIYPKARLTIVGDGSEGEWLKMRAQSLGIDESISWIPHLPQADLFGIYRRCNCFLFPSLHDSSGNVVLEAMSFGLPVVCLDLGGPATLVDSSCSIVVPVKNLSSEDIAKKLAESVVSIYSNEESRLVMSKSAILRAHAFTWKGRVIGALNLLQSKMLRGPHEL